MTFLSRLNPFKKKNPFRDSKFIIKEAFEVDGVKYYEMDDIFNIPCLRGLAAIKYYEEIRMKCSLEFLQMHTKAIETALRSNPIDVFQINELNKQLSDRLNFLVDTDTVYKLASVVYFDESEKPEDYEMGYNLKKIEKWKKAEGVNAFFLRQPIQRLIPFLNLQDFDIQTYSKVVEQVTQEHLANILETLSPEQKKEFTMQFPSYRTQA